MPAHHELPDPVGHGDATNPPDASLSVVTSSTSTFTAAWQTIDYSYLVTNTGGSSLTSISVTDNVPLNTGNPASTRRALRHR